MKNHFILLIFRSSLCFTSVRVQETFFFFTNLFWSIKVTVIINREYSSIIKFVIFFTAVISMLSLCFLQLLKKNLNFGYF